MTFERFGLLKEATKVNIASRTTILLWCVVIIAETFLIYGIFGEALMMRLHFLKRIVALREVIVCITITFKHHLW